MFASRRIIVSHKRVWNVSWKNTGVHQNLQGGATVVLFQQLQFRSKTTNNFSDDNFVVSILGPPNAGKSTLFNRLQCKERNRTYRLGSSKKRARGRIASKQTSRGDAIVSSIAGTTRDRRDCWGRIGGTEFKLMDTAGVDGDRIQQLGKTKPVSKIMDKQPTNIHNALERSMMEQTLEAAKKSDLVLLLWDAKVGVTQDLAITARWLRKLGKQSSDVAILANKLEGDAWAHDDRSPVLQNLQEVNRLGLGEAIPISALQGDGMADIAILIEQMKAQKLEEEVDARLGQDEELFVSTFDNDSIEDDDDKPRPLQMAVLGRQNVGKSTLVNTLLKSERVIAGPTPGLTRDAIAIEWTWDGKQPIQLVDTAGIRKLTKRLDDSIEDMAVADALRAMKVAEVAVLVLDAEALYLHRQELAICNAIMEEGRALVIAANKMDLLDLSSEYTSKDFADSVREQLETRIPILRNTPIVPMSCLAGGVEGVSDLLPVVLDARERWSKTISTGLLNRWLKEVIDGVPPPVVGGIHAKLKYIIQTKGRPPTFLLFSNVGELPDTYLRYLTKHFQTAFELYGMPVRLIVRKSAKQNPYLDKKQQQRSGFGLGGREGRQRRRVKGYIAKRKKDKAQS